LAKRYQPKKANGVLEVTRGVNEGLNGTRPTFRSQRYAHVNTELFKKKVHGPEQFSEP
jgi:hypothetical protein